MKKYIYYILIACIYTSCGNIQAQNLSPIAKNYIDEVVNLLQKKSVNRKNINWKVFRNDIYCHAKGSVTIENTYPSISYAITKLDDHHSYFAPNIVVEDTNDLKPLPILKDEKVPENIGYIRVGFCMGNEKQTNNFINTITEKISKQDNSNLKGWIVDLRGNFGGNMWPMLVAIGPILGDGIIGYSFYPDGSFYSWNYSDGKIYSENGIVGQSNTTYHLLSPNPYVAILTDNVTASSGEAVTIAFKGRKKTKSFGIETFGVSTGNNSYTLSDGSRINLTECVFADRTKKKYGKSVYPDVICQENKTLAEAINWISNQQ